MDDVKATYDRLHRGFAAFCVAGRHVGDEDVQALVAEHFALIKRFYTPTAEMYAGLGRMYVEHPDFRKLYESYHPKLAEYLAEAMGVFAAERL